MSSAARACRSASAGSAARFASSISSQPISGWALVGEQAPRPRDPAARGGGLAVDAVLARQVDRPAARRHGSRRARGSPRMPRGGTRSRRRARPSTRTTAPTRRGRQRLRAPSRARSGTRRARRASPRARTAPIREPHLARRTSWPPLMRTCVRVCSSLRPPRRPRLFLCLGRAARRPVVARATGDRRPGCRARGQLRGEGVRRAKRDGRRAGAPALPPGRCGAVPDGGLLRGQQGGVPDLRGHGARGGGALDRRGIPGRARHGALRGHARGDRHAAAAPGSQGGRSADQRGRGAHEVPRQGRERGGQAGRAAAGPAGRRARVPPPAAGRAALGRRPDDRRKPPRAGLRTVGQVAELAEGVLVEMLGRATGRQLHALANVRDPRRVERRRRRRSIGAQHALGRRSRSPEAVDASLVGLVDR